MKVLVACEFSGIVREAFVKQGHDAWSCDFLPTEIPGNHIQDDVLNHLDEGWDLMVAHPTCTYLTNAGVCWLHKDKKRWKQLEKGCVFFNKLKNAPITHICIENPIPHGYAKDKIGTYSQLIQPYEFGHLERKATCLWLKNLPTLVPTKIVKKEMNLLPKNIAQRTHYMTPGPNRWKERSRTFNGIAQAMATQWGNPESIEMDPIYP